MIEYTTEELVRSLRGPTLCNNEVDAIIARLRAADKLYEAAKNIRMTIATDNEVWESHIEQLRKAIAEYEEEK